MKSSINIAARFDALPLSKKLRALIITVTGTALLLSGLITTSLLFIDDRRDLVRHTAVLSNTIATTTTAALAFNDKKTASRLLAALESDPNIIGAVLTDAQGSLVATFGKTFDKQGMKPAQNLSDLTRQRKAQSGSDQYTGDYGPFVASLEAEPIFHRLSMDYATPVRLDDQVIGHIIIRTNLEPLYAQLFTNSLIMLAVFLVTGAAAMSLSKRMQTRISDPITTLASTMDDVASRADFSVRVKPGAKDETGRLIAGFNAMISGLQDREARLRKYREELENTVELRTSELRSVNDSLRIVAREAENARDLAEEASRAKSDFLAIMSHEIRTPMNGVLGMSELLLETQLTPRQKRFANVIQYSGTSLLHIINDILDFSKIEAGRLELESVEFALRELVEDVAESMAEQAQSKGLDINLRMDPQLSPMLLGDAMRLKQVLINLISNAVKFTETGEVNIDVDVENAASEQTSQVTISVSDTGIGIDESQQEAIFDSFSQADSSTTRRFGGTGLGLTITSQLVELMEGTMDVDSAIGQGSTFSVSIPFPTVTPQTPSQLMRDDLAGIRILVVDDNATNREILYSQLTSWAMHCDTAENASQALSKLSMATDSDRPFDIAIIDGQMPDTSGIELAREISQTKQIHTPKIILLSSVIIDRRTMDQDRSCVSHYLSKPVKQKALFNVLCEAGGEVIVAEEQTRTPNWESFPARILVAEDNRVNQEVVRSVLELFQCDVTVVDNGEKAVTAVARQHFDIVFMDFHMPVMDGFAATAAIRALELEKSIAPIVIIGLSANAQAGIAEESLRRGMDAYLGKPFTATQIEDQLRRWLPEAHRKADEEDVAGMQPALKEETVQRLSNVGDTADNSLFWKISTIFLEDAPEQLRKIREELTAANLSTAGGHAHSLKSSSANIGAEQLSTLCRELENLCKTEQTLSPQIDALAEELATEGERTLDELRRRREDIRQNA